MNIARGCVFILKLLFFERLLSRHAWALPYFCLLDGRSRMNTEIFHVWARRTLQATLERCVARYTHTRPIVENPCVLVKSLNMPTPAWGAEVSTPSRLGNTNHLPADMQYCQKGVSAVAKFSDSTIVCVLLTSAELSLLSFSRRVLTVSSQKAIKHRYRCTIYVGKGVKSLWNLQFNNNNLWENI